MPDATHEPILDFAGFIDGFQARNLASIQRSISLQLSEMQTRLSVVKAQTQSNPTVTGIVLSVDAAFHDSNGTIVDRLALVGERLTQLLIEHRDSFSADPDLQLQIKGFIRAYLDAAEISRNQRLIDRALLLAESYREASAVAA